MTEVEAPAYYEGAVSAYERELQALREGVEPFDNGRLPQFKAMLRDYAQMHNALTKILAVCIISRAVACDQPVAIGRLQGLEELARKGLGVDDND